MVLLLNHYLLIKNFDGRKYVILMFIIAIITGFDVGIGSSRLVLRFLGVWPDPKRKKKFLSRGHFLIPSLIMFYFVNIPQTIMVSKVWGDLNAVLEILTTSDIPIGIALFKLLGLWYNGDGIHIQLFYVEAQLI